MTSDLPQQSFNGDDRWCPLRNNIVPNSFYAIGADITHSAPDKFTEILIIFNLTLFSHIPVLLFAN